MSKPFETKRVAGTTLPGSVDANLETLPLPPTFEPPPAPALPIADASFPKVEIITPGSASSLPRRPIVRSLSPMPEPRIDELSAPAAMSVLAPAALTGGVHSNADGGLVAAWSAPPPAKRPRHSSASPCRAGPIQTAIVESMEERRRRRILSNRESAMRSLQKKADFTAKLEEDEREQEQILSARREALADVMSVAEDARKLIATGDGGNDSLAAEVDDCLARCRAAMEDGAPEQSRGGLLGGALDTNSFAEPSVDAEEVDIPDNLLTIGAYDSRANIARTTTNAHIEVEATAEAGVD